ncbi:hypothetical protein D9M71_396940 [compost metagenome]
MDGAGDLLGLDALAVDPGAGLLGDRREFVGRGGQLADAAADMADQLGQAVAHALHAALQLAQFVEAVGVGMAGEAAGQVAPRDAFGKLQGLA